MNVPFVMKKSLEERLFKVENQGQLLQRERQRRMSPSVVIKNETSHLQHCQLEMILNKDETIVTLKGVRYSPRLKKNLISDGTFEPKGFEVREKDGGSDGTISALTHGGSDGKHMV
nr:retrovirus-related Pol polyprotein from transposon TNT 1-94 [Tanacetum cinerariifolium]